MSGGVSIRREDDGDGGAFYADEGGARVGEMTWWRREDGAAVIDHTEVHGASRNRGVGRLLVAAAVEWARASGTKLDATCRFARAVLQRDGSAQDVLAPTAPSTLRRPGSTPR
jgi:uncharacterized protein